MKHSEFIEKFKYWEPAVEMRKAGKSFTEIADHFHTVPLVAGGMVKFVERNQSVPKCEWLGDFTQESVKKLSSKVRILSKQEMREDLIKHFAKSTGGAYKPYPKLISPGILRHVLDASGLKWGELNGKPVVQWNEKP